jgi:simple sugar transport system ATP-binding protein
VYEICDRITVLRGGRLVGEYVPSELLRIDLVQKMLGRNAAELGSRARADAADAESEAVLRGSGVTNAPGIIGADIDLAEGEVLGLAGLLGSGRTELARALSGIDRLDAGIITISGQPVDLTSPRKAISLGVVYSSENRRTEGIISELSVQENITLALQAERGILRRLPAQRRRELAMSWIEALDIRPADPDRRAGTLSGGNQQKVLLARLLALSPRVIVLDEPTRGIDVGAKVEIQNLVGELADNGLSVVFISAELEEVLRVADRVAVLRAGRIIETHASDELTVDSLLALVAQPDEFSEVESSRAPSPEPPSEPAPTDGGPA